MITQSNHQDSETSVVSALRRMFDAGHRMVVDRIELARVDILAVLAGALHGALLVVLGIIPAAIGWLVVMRALVLVLESYFAPVASLAIVGAVNVLLGVGAMMAGVHRMRVGAETVHPTNGAAVYANHRAEGHPAHN